MRLQPSQRQNAASYVGDKLTTRKFNSDEPLLGKDASASEGITVKRSGIRSPDRQEH